MNTEALGVVLGTVGAVVGLALGDATTAVLAGILGFFGGKVAESLTKTVGTE